MKNLCLLLISCFLMGMETSTPVSLKMDLIKQTLKDLSEKEIKQVLSNYFSQKNEDSFLIFGNGNEKIKVNRSANHLVFSYVQDGEKHTYVDAIESLSLLHPSAKKWTYKAEYSPNKEIDIIIEKTKNYIFDVIRNDLIACLPR